MSTFHEIKSTLASHLNGSSDKLLSNFDELIFTVDSHDLDNFKGGNFKELREI